MGLNFTGDTEIQTVKVEIPVLVTKEDYGCFRIELPALDPIEAGGIGIKQAKSYFDIIVRANLLTKIILLSRRRVRDKDLESIVQVAIKNTVFITKEALQNLVDQEIERRRKADATAKVKKEQGQT